MFDRDVYENGHKVWLYLDVLNTTSNPMSVATFGPWLRRHLTLTDSEGQTVALAPLPPLPPFHQRRTGPETVNIQSLPAGKQMQVMLFFVFGNEHAMYGELPAGRYQASWSVEPRSTVKGARIAPSVSVSFEVAAAPDGARRAVA